MKIENKDQKVQTSRRSFISLGIPLEIINTHPIFKSSNYSDSSDSDTETREVLKSSNFSQFSEKNNKISLKSTYPAQVPKIPKYVDTGIQYEENLKTSIS